MPIGLDEFVRIRDRCLQATAGPWIHAGEGFVESTADSRPVIGVTCKREGTTQNPLPADENAEFIAEARTAVPKLLDEVERLQRALKQIADGEVSSAEQFAAHILAGE